MMLIIRKYGSYSKNIRILFQADNFLWIRLGYALCLIKKGFLNLGMQSLLVERRLLIVINKNLVFLKLEKLCLI